jgi:hypothetical protein
MYFRVSSLAERFNGFWVGAAEVKAVGVGLECEERLELDWGRGGGKAFP